MKHALMGLIVLSGLSAGAALAAETLHCEVYKKVARPSECCIVTNPDGDCERTGPCLMQYFEGPYYLADSPISDDHAFVGNGGKDLHYFASAGNSGITMRLSYLLATTSPAPEGSVSSYGSIEKPLELDLTVGTASRAGDVTQVKLSCQKK